MVQGPSQARHEHTAVITSLCLTSYNIGSALGASVSGAIWTQLLPGEPGELENNFTNSTLAALAYGDPHTFILDYQWGTPERVAMVAAYQHIQKIILIVGTCIYILLIIVWLWSPLTTGSSRCKFSETPRTRKRRR